MSVSVWWRATLKADASVVAVIDVVAPELTAERDVLTVDLQPYAKRLRSLVPADELRP